MVNNKQFKKRTWIFIGIISISLSLIFMLNAMAKGNGINDIYFTSSTTEDKVLETMNRMTHQKIEAKEKWGFVLMSEKNIEIVYETISESHYENKEILLEIATKWLNGDFSEVDKDHNTIWGLQGGTIGEATGLLTEEEENKLIRYNFD